jgi:hypothetical protein
MSEVTPGDRDALRRIMDERAVADVDLPPLDRDAALADAIFAAGFRRVSPVTREAIAAVLVGIGIKPHDPAYYKLIDALSLLSVSPPAEVEVTDDMVERGARAMYWDAHPQKQWADLLDMFKSLYRSHVRAALVAALAPAEVDAGPWAPVTPGEGKEQ